MAKKPIHVTSEIGDLQRVVLHRPGRELANMKAAEFEKCWIHDAFYLEYAQKEHDAFANILREAGSEVLYMEELLAEAMDANPGRSGRFPGRIHGPGSHSRSGARAARAREAGRH